MLDYPTVVGGFAFGLQGRWQDPCLTCNFYHLHFDFCFFLTQPFFQIQILYEWMLHAPMLYPLIISTKFSVPSVVIIGIPSIPNYRSFSHF
jgi:hypothetical protein